MVYLNEDGVTNKHSRQLVLENLFPLKCSAGEDTVMASAAREDRAGAADLDTDAHAAEPDAARRGDREREKPSGAAPRGSRAPCDFKSRVMAQPWSDSDLDALSRSDLSESDPDVSGHDAMHISSAEAVGHHGDGGRHYWPPMDGAYPVEQVILFEQKLCQCRPNSSMCACVHGARVHPML